MAAWGAALIGLWKKQNRSINGQWVKGFSGVTKAESPAEGVKGVSKGKIAAAGVGAAVAYSAAFGSKRSRTRVTSRSAMHSQQRSVRVPGGALTVTGTVSFKRNQTKVEKNFKRASRDVGRSLAKKGTAGAIAGALIDNKLSYGSDSAKGGFIAAPKKTRKMRTSVSTSGGVGKIKTGTTTVKNVGSNSMPKKAKKVSPKKATSGTKVYGLSLIHI